MLQNFDDQRCVAIDLQKKTEHWLADSGKKNHKYLMANREDRNLSVSQMEIIFQNRTRHHARDREESCANY